MHQTSGPVPPRPVLRDRSIWQDVPRQQWLDWRWQMQHRVRPYYSYQCDLAEGLEHFRTTVAKGIEIMEHLRGRISGLGVPSFVVDAPCGGGRVPVHPNRVVSQHEHKVVLRNFEGRLVVYEEPRDYTGMCSEGAPCAYCREVEGSGGPTGVAGLFNDDPNHIARLPAEEDAAETVSAVERGACP